VSATLSCYGSATLAEDAGSWLAPSTLVAVGGGTEAEEDDTVLQSGSDSEKELDLSSSV
jgi:hypothetical protein